MMDFSKDSVFNLKQIGENEINKNVFALLVDDEAIIEGYKTIRDQVIFTTKRIITVDVQGLTGKRQELFSLPYTNIQYFGIQTPGLVELLPDSELVLFFSNGRKVEFEFKGKSRILEIGRVISSYALR